MSLQEQPMQQQPQPLPQSQPQPVQVYPTTITYQSPPEPNNHSNGSFGSVFIVLAIIIIISAVACCLGRFCSRRGNGQKHGGKPQKQQKHQNQHSRPKEVDIEFGFDKKIAASKPMNNNGHSHHGGVRVQKPISHHGHQDMKSFEIKLGPPQGKYRSGP